MPSAGETHSESSERTHGSSRRKPRPPSPFYLPLNITLYVFLISSGIAAFNAPIQDCDEVFNFWEPTHYLRHGYGLQTWEYSPVYSIRSWLYVSIHAIVGKASSLFLHHKVLEFYAIRFFLAAIYAACQTRLYSAICRTLSPRIGLLFVMISAFSPGIFHASISLLPSSFAMYMSMLGLTAFLDWQGGSIAQGIMWFGVGSIIGWPFAGALMIPFLVEELTIGFLAGSIRKAVIGILSGISRCLIIMAIEIAVDYLFFQRFTAVPWNIVAYNVFGGQGRGPNVFGTEPWTFYIRNLLLNFNIWLVFAVSAMPLLVLQAVLRPQAITKKTSLRSLTLATPLYVWLAIFTLQPHKEERFMYPAYPFLALNAAISLHLLLSYAGSSDPRRIIGRIPAKFKLIVAVAIALVAVSGGLLRIAGITTAYSAPLRIFESLEQPKISEAGGSVCFGKEWYRFPSSFFLPNNMRAKFIRSEFRGLLPGEFLDAAGCRNLIDGTSRVPVEMNDRNEEDPARYIDISQCSFLVDSYFPGNVGSGQEPNYILDESQWEEITCERFLDASQTSLLGRLIWVPELPVIPSRFRRKWGRYCLLRRRNGSSKRD